jgi:hypothetical protein
MSGWAGRGHAGLLCCADAQQDHGMPFLFLDIETEPLFIEKCS